MNELHVPQAECRALLRAHLSDPQTPAHTHTLNLTALLMLDHFHSLLQLLVSDVICVSFES